MDKNLLMNDTYHTPEDKQRAFMDRLMLNSRFYFTARFMSIVLNSRRLALEGVYDTAAWASSSHDIFNLIEDCGGRFHLSGLDNIRRCQGPVVFISNHMSTLETMIFPGIIAPFIEVTFVVKDSLIKGNLFGPIMRSRNPIAVSRVNPKEDLQVVMSKGQELLSSGMSLIIFPQSTRTTEFMPEEFNSLGVKLAGRAGVQVVPVAIKTDFWGNGSLIKDLGPIDRDKPIYMHFGEPFSISGTGKEDHKRIVGFISSKLQEWSNIKE